MESGWPGVLPREVHSTLERIEAQDPWFEIYRVSDETYAIIEPFHFEEAISYLITGKNRAILLDTGMGVGDLRGEVERLTSLPVAVLNTHWHYDHIAGNYQFDDIWAFDDDFEVGKIARGLSFEEIGYKFDKEWVCAPLPDGFKPSEYCVRGSTVTRRVKHLETLDIGGRVLTVHHTPGHSPGSICVFDEQLRILFSGDTYYPGRMYCNLERSEFKAFLASLEYLSELAGNAVFVSPSHNEAKVPTTEISDAHEAFLRIAAGQAASRLEGKARVYRFDRFSVELPDMEVN